MRVFFARSFVIENMVWIEKSCWQPVNGSFGNTVYVISQWLGRKSTHTDKKTSKKILSKTVNENPHFSDSTWHVFGHPWGLGLTNPQLSSSAQT